MRRTKVTFHEPGTHSRGQFQEGWTVKKHTWDRSKTSHTFNYLGPFREKNDAIEAAGKEWGYCPPSRSIFVPLSELFVLFVGVSLLAYLILHNA